MTSQGQSLYQVETLWVVRFYAADKQTNKQTTLDVLPNPRRVSTSRVDGPSTRLVETRACQHGLCWRVMETGHPSTRAVNSGRQLG